MNIKRELLRNYFIFICILAQIADSLQIEDDDQVNSSEDAEEFLFIDKLDDENHFKNTCTLPNQTIDRSCALSCMNGHSYPSGVRRLNEFDYMICNCNPGYSKKNGNHLSQSECRRGNWQQDDLECTRICKRLFPSEDLIVKCYKDDEEINCHQPLLSGTKVRATCKPYRRQVDTQSENPIVCENGQWNGTLPECVLECGKINGDDFTNKVHGDIYNYNRFPWHVAIYDVSSTPVLICSGSIISPILIITAVDCVRDIQTGEPRDVKNFEIIVAKVTPDYYFQDNEFQKSYKVHKIYSALNIFRELEMKLGVVILEVVEEISYSYGVSPVCFMRNILNEYMFELTNVMKDAIHNSHNGTSERTMNTKISNSMDKKFKKKAGLFYNISRIRKGRYTAKVASWGIIDLNNVHETDFRIDEYTANALENCADDEDKFCGQLSYGAGTYISDMGAGFHYQQEEQYYLMGIVNKKYRYRNNFAVTCLDLEITKSRKFIATISKSAINRRVIDNAASNFKTRPECEHEGAFDIKVQKASVCIAQNRSDLILPCKRTCDKLLQPQAMRLTCIYGATTINCDQELISGVEVSFRCIDGHKPKHQLNFQSIKCQENGKWSNELFPCIKDDIISCALPLVTEDKTYTIDCDPSIKYTQSDAYVKELTMLSFQCNPGYYYQEFAPKNKSFFCEPDIYYKEKLNNFQVICLNGTWTPRIGNCSKLCKVFTSINLEPECYFNNKTISCNQPLFAGTRMRPLCQEYHHKKYEVELEELTCSENGEWDGFPIECVPNCGRNMRDKISSHVSIIDKEIESPICAGTLISAYLVLTAARCFYNPTKKRLILDANRYEIIAGKSEEFFSPIVQMGPTKYQVKTIYYTNKGKTKVIANYSEDLAVLEMVEKITFWGFDVEPACVNWHQPNEFNFTQYYTFTDHKAAQPGKIMKWGDDHFKNDGTYLKSDSLLATYFPYEYSVCQQFTENKSINNSDLFCLHKPDTYYENFTSKNHKLETSDYGAGFVQIRGDSKEYYVQGVFSLITTNESFYQVISTNYHAKWLNKIRWHVEKRRTFEESRKYFDVDSFHRKDDCQDGIPILEHGSNSKLRISCNASSINRGFSKGCKLPQRKLYNINYEHICPPNDYKSYCQGVGENGSVPEMTKLYYNCSEGYADPASASTNRLASFCDDGWSPPITKCKKYCMKLKPINVKLTCSYNEVSVSCKRDHVQGTVVFPECIPEYEPELEPRYKEITCLPNGQWSDVLYRCKPKCGKSASNVTTLIRGGYEARFGEFPWHVAIYDKTTNNTLICGGSIISPYVIVSAAHCFYDQQRNEVKPASNYVTAVGKISRDISNKDSEVTAFYEIEKIIVENYLGVILRFQFDIAILQIKDKITFNPQVIPICLRQSGTTIIPSGEILHVAGWGLDDTDEPSSTLRVGAMPYISINECLQKVQDHLLGFISTDKFCVENANGSIVDQGDSGGGLSRVDKVSSLHYLVGIVSYRATNSPTVAVITDITQDRYIRWISQQLNEIHRAKNYYI